MSRSTIPSPMTGRENTSASRVAIVGAGPVGLTTALLMRQQGLEAVVFERLPGAVRLPKAHVINIRTAEVFRQLGLYDAVRDAAAPADRMRHITWRDAVAGTTFGSVPIGAGSPIFENARAASPVRFLNIAQDTLEQVLRNALEAAGGRVLYGHAVSGASRDGDVARLTVEQAGGTVSVEEFDIVLACDGAASTIRRDLGIEMKGPPSIARFASCYFTADLNDHFGDETGPVHFIGGPDVSGTLISYDLDTTWAFMCVIPPEATSEDFPAETVLELVRRAIGDESIEPDLINVGTWNMSAQRAERFADGPFFLLGDAAHRFPPSGGLGLNTGVGDAQNIVWKLAMVQRGEAPRSLLDTYEAERAPVALRNCQHSVHNLMNLASVDAAVGAPFLQPVDPTVVNRPATPRVGRGPDDGSAIDEEQRQLIAQAIDAQRQHFGAVRVEVGHQYGEDEWGPQVDLDELPGVAVGARLPHLWIDADERTSLLDLPQTDGYTLLTAVPVDRLDTSSQTLARHGVAVVEVPALAALDPDQHVIVVRPDGHVLWHGNHELADALAAIHDLHSGRVQHARPILAGSNER